jgi:phage terminase large subunit
MKQVVNSAYKELFNNDKRYIILLGGRGAGRSTVASQFVVSKLLAPEYFRCAIMRLVLGDIRNSVYREIADRLEEAEIRDLVDVNETMMTIKYGQNFVNAQGFKKSSGEQKAKLKSLANYTCVVIEEADEIAEEDFIQLDDSLRTIKEDIKIIFLLNPPPKNHWIIKRWFDLIATEESNFYQPVLKESEQHNTLFINTTYKDNIQNIDNATVERYEKYLDINRAHYFNMIKGYIPETLVGKIYSGWNVIDKVPHEARLIGYGLDFGYSCLGGDTLIKTKNGDKKIKDIKKGEYVFTRDGYKEITFSGKTGRREVYELDFGYKKNIIVTGDHKIFTTDGWKKVTELKTNEKICQLKQLYLKAKNTIDTQKENTQNISIIKLGIKKRELIKFFIEKFGKINLARFPKNIIYTIKMATLSIIKSIILCVYHLASIVKYMHQILKNIQVQDLDIQKKTGKKEEKKVYKQQLKESKIASNAIKKLYQQMCTKSSVLQFVEREIIQEIVKKNILVNGARKNLLEQHTIKEIPVLKSVPIKIQLLKGKRDVYDLTVKDSHEFFANGLLVHNCDPTALAACYFYNGGYIFEEKLYQTEISAEQLAIFIKTLPYAPIVADSASPAMIEELRLKGIRVVPVEKGPGSIVYGINAVRNLKISYTRSSINLEKEYNEYAWKINKSTGESMGTHDDKCPNDILDAIRYCAVTFIVNHNPYEEIREEIKLQRDRMSLLRDTTSEYGL